MATGKKYFWIKLRTSFLTSDKVDFLMSQKDGANYVVLYQMLCLKTINSGGELSWKVGEVIIPYDADKIQRDCKYFSKDTVLIALELFKKIGMIYSDENGTLVITEFAEMVGGETDYAKQKRIQRNTAELLCGQNKDSAVDNVHTEIEIDKEIDKEIELDIEKDIKKKKEKKPNLYEGLPDELVSVLKDFSDMRKAGKGTFTDRAKVLMLNELKRLADKNGVIDTQLAIKILEQSIMNGWKSVYPLKENKNNYKKQADFLDFLEEE